MGILSAILSGLHLNSQLGDSLPIARSSLAPRASDPIVKSFPFPDAIDFLQILPVSGDTGMEETVLALGASGSLYRTHDFGIKWERVPNVKDVIMIDTSNYDINRVYLSSKGSPNSLFYSSDRGSSFTEIKMPESEMGAPSIALNDHSNPDWFIYNNLNCTDHWCSQNAYYSKDKGKTWTLLMEDADCYFAKKDSSNSTDNELGMHISPDLVICESTLYDKHHFKVRYLTGSFNDLKMQEVNIKGLRYVYVRGDYVMAMLVEDDHRQIAVSRDGIHFHRAAFPANIHPRMSFFGGFNILQNDGPLVVYEKEDFMTEFGVVLHSGKYGYEFTPVLENVYSPMYGWHTAEYTPLKSVEGVILANIVSNPEKVKAEEETPIVKTVISHSDGNKWAPIKGPSGEPLHLRQFTGNMFMMDDSASDSPTAAGIYICTGNEGDSLTDSTMEYNTYMTRDGGMNWFKISDSPMLHSIGDQGALIVMVSATDPTDHLKYSYDEGATWQSYSWGYEAAVLSLETVPSGSSRRFLMRLRSSSGMDTHLVTLDFFTEGLQMCEASDFEKWTPEHPQLGTKCLLGREVEYTRKIRDRNCFVGAHDNGNSRPGQRKTVKNCQCTREDYECDYTHVLDPDTKECKLIEGQKIPSQEDQCKHDSIYWKKITGYRKLATSSCEGGETIEVDERYACPGKEKEFEDGKWLGDPGLKPLPLNKKKLIIKILLGLLIAVAIIVVLLVVIRFRLEILDILRNVVGSFPLVAGFFSKLFSRYHVSLPEDDEDSPHHMQNWWQTAKSYIPFVGKRQPEDHLGFYSTMDDDERDRILEEDRDYRDESDGDENVSGGGPLGGDDDHETPTW